MNKSYFTIKVFILIDHLGEWWETIKKDGSLRFLGNPEEKVFRNFSKAKAYAEKHHKKFKVIEVLPPQFQKNTYRERVVYEQ